MIEDRDEVGAAPEELLVGLGGKMGFKVNEEEDEAAGPEVSVMTVVDEEVTVTGQTVVETGTIIVLTGQSLMPGPQL